jgi:hypothetical protein
MMIQHPGARTSKGLSFERYQRALSSLFTSTKAEDRAKVKAANDAFITGLRNPQFTDKRLDDAVGQLVKALTPANVHVDKVLSSFSVAYANDEFIGERIMPVVPVDNRSDKFAVFSKRDRLAAPDDRIGFRSSPNEVEQNFSYDNYSLSDYGLKGYLDLEMVQNADNVLREMLNTIEFINSQLAFRREMRIAAIAQTSSNFTTANATTKWDTANTGGSIIADILAAKAALWNGPAPTRLVGFTTLEVWNASIINNPALKALYSGVRDGLVTQDIVAAYFGLDEIVIANGRQDTANEGQTASYGKLWTSDNFGIVRVARNPNTRALQWGVTFREKGDPFTTEWTDPSIGKRGGIYGRVSVSEDHKVVSKDAGYLITDVLT